VKRRCCIASISTSNIERPHTRSASLGRGESGAEGLEEGSITLPTEEKKLVEPLPTAVRPQGPARGAQFEGTKNRGKDFLREWAREVEREEFELRECEKARELEKTFSGGGTCRGELSLNVRGRRVGVEISR